MIKRVFIYVPPVRRCNKCQGLGTYRITVNIVLDARDVETATHPTNAPLSIAHHVLGAVESIAQRTKAALYI